MVPDAGWLRHPFHFSRGFIRESGIRTFGTQSAFDVIVSITLGGMLGKWIIGHYPFFASLLLRGHLIKHGNDTNNVLMSIRYL